MRDADSPLISDEGYRRLSEEHQQRRRVEQGAERAARAAGLTPALAELLLAVRAHRGAPGPSIADVAGALVVRHHSAVELVTRAERAGLVGRRADAADRRVVRLFLTDAGALALAGLAALHAEELARLDGRADY